MKIKYPENAIFIIHFRIFILFSYEKLLIKENN